METLKLSTLLRIFQPELEDLLTDYELSLPVVLKHGIDSVSDHDILEIIEASIQHNGKGTLLLQ